MTISRRWPAGRDATRDGSFHAAGLDLVCKFWNPSALMTPLLKSGIAAPCHVYAFECCGALIPETVGTAPRVDRSKRRDPTRLSTAVSLRLRVACFVPRILAARAMLPRSEINSAKLRGSGLRRIFASSETIYRSYDCHHVFVDCRSQRWMRSWRSCTTGRRLHHTTGLPRIRQGWCETRPALVRRVTRMRARPKSADAASAANSRPSDSRRQRGVPGPHYR